MNPSAVLLLVPIAFTVGPVQDSTSTAKRPSDPTAIDAELLRVLARPSAGGAGGASMPVAPFPTVAIRGLVVPSRGEAFAILEVDAARVRVRVGSIVPFANGDRLRVDSIGAGEIVLFRESTGETRAVR